MNIERYKIKPNQNVKLDDYRTSENKKQSNETIEHDVIPGLVETLAELQLKLFAEAKSGILVVLQALDAAGKDEAISYIFSNLNAQGLKVTTFGKPSEEEQNHDYLWRLHDGMPERGQIGILNRSYYEEVIVTRVHDLIEDEHTPEDEDTEDVWQLRYRQLNDYERYLYENHFYVIKFFFHMSKDEQKNRLLERMKDPKKNWEFSFNDVKEREYWEEYIEAFEEMLKHTSTEYSPWYILPADDEWYSRQILSEAMIALLKDINPEFPEMSGEEKEKMDEYIKKLENE